MTLWLRWSLRKSSTIQELTCCRTNIRWRSLGLPAPHAPNSPCFTTAGKEMPIPDTVGLARRCRLSIIVLILEKCFWFWF